MSAIATLDNRCIGGRYVTRELVPERRLTWRQKVCIIDDDGARHVFYVDFGEYPDGRLADVFISAKRHGTFTCGVLNSLARAVSLAVQSGTSPMDMARQLVGQDYPPRGRVEAEGSKVTSCTSIADYIGQEIAACYGEDGRRRSYE